MPTVLSIMEVICVRHSLILEWLLDKRHGMGVFTSTKPGVSFKYEGRWEVTVALHNLTFKNGQRHGEGALYFPGDQVFKGKFDQGRPLPGIILSIFNYFVD